MSRGQKVYVLLVIIIGIWAIVYGANARKTFTNIVASPDFWNGFYVAEITERFAKARVEEMSAIVKGAENVLVVTPTEEMKYFFRSGWQKVQVLEVIRGEETLKEKDISLVYDGWKVILSDNINAMESGFVNRMKKDRKYLVFLEKPYPAVNGKEIYPFLRNAGMLSMFCLDEVENMVIPIESDAPSTYVLYNLVKDNEFFVTSKEASRTLEEMKREIIEEFMN